MKKLSIALSFVGFAGLLILAVMYLPQKEKPPTECEMLVSWGAPKEKTDKDGIVRPVNGYKLYLKRPEDKSFVEFVDVGNVLEYNVENLKKGKSYDIKIVAYNDKGDGEASELIRKNDCLKQGVTNDI